jgi:hypothetical protein
VSGGRRYGVRERECDNGEGGREGGREERKEK